MPVTTGTSGFRMPAEWERHRGTWISWPKDPNTFHVDILPAVERAYVKMVLALTKGEEVHVLVNDSKAEERVRTMLGNAEVAFHHIRTVDVWVRDYGPIYVKGGRGAVIKWRFNAWGGKYDDLKPDDRAGEEMAASSGLPVVRPGIVLEGGSVDVNGAGSLLTTEQCLLNPNRNPGIGKGELEEILRANLGATNSVWLGTGIEGDDTDGHVDDVARFVGPREVVAAVEPDRGDGNHLPLTENLRRLNAATDQEGRRLEVFEIPMPPRIETHDGRLPASHLNFYIGNEVVVVPTFGGGSDKLAIQCLEEMFPRREVLGIDCRALVHGLGTLHCVTQQIPVVD
jgi:agmatine deiminase